MGGHYDKNASHLITKLLPAMLPSNTAINPTSARINIVNPTSADGAYVLTDYGYIRKYIREMHTQHAKDIDLFVHLGMAYGWHFVSVERRAYKQGFSSVFWGPRGKQQGYYMIPDDAGRTVKDAGPCPWGDDVPMGLCSAFDIDTVVEDAQTILDTKHKFAPSKPVMLDTRDEEADLNDASAKGRSSISSDIQIPVKAHHEGGDYCCGYIHYESLANCYVNGRIPDVLFCHVPGETDQEMLEKSKDAVVAVIVSAVNQLLGRRASEKPKSR